MGACIACNAQDVELNDEEMCDDCAKEMTGAEETPPMGTEGEEEA